MKVTAIELENVRSFYGKHEAQFSNTINVFIGANNSGKTTILNSIFILQRDELTNSYAITIGESISNLKLFTEGDGKKYFSIDQEKNFIYADFTNNEKYINTKIPNSTGNNTFRNKISEYEPDNLIYPFLSKRKVKEYSVVVNNANANLVKGDLSNLVSKIDRLVTKEKRKASDEFYKECEKILGFDITARLIDNGKEIAYIASDNSSISLSLMGEGVPNLLGIIADLCVAKDKIFLIEEPENDIHPKALKGLLELIIKKSETNQIFVSTHSNIVMKYLGSTPKSKIFSITSELTNNKNKDKKFFVSKISEIANNPEERRKILEDLGYDFFDFDLWKGWLFLEESSAEFIIREYLVSWFAPSLKYKLRTYSAGGFTNVESRFKDFKNLFTFLHLEPAYKNRVWVKIDGGNDEANLISKMKNTFVKEGSWNDSNFSQFEQDDFEKYYPFQFQDDVDKISKIEPKENRRKEKKNLLDEVKKWVNQNEELARIEFELSAHEVIEFLKIIELELS